LADELAGSDWISSASAGRPSPVAQGERLPHIKIGKEIWVDEKQLREWVGLHARVHFAAPPARTRSRIVRVGYQSGGGFALEHARH